MSIDTVRKATVATAALVGASLLVHPASADAVADFYNEKNHKT